ncbi:hypothetical protein BURPS1710b_A1405 [Burkholderia pseudomallei 1710b]|uniref:Uncharacterized protein n=1 Tax=Burkholderia pseudomallei (strain 1710b) TaxID=320372 RepID=Q3JIP1_BURP1|nr:hypothetical protein BURPS1710b_A1405 [Burkholderia pseudomallei 1710b]
MAAGGRDAGATLFFPDSARRVHVTVRNLTCRREPPGRRAPCGCRAKPPSPSHPNQWIGHGSTIHLCSFRTLLRRARAHARRHRRRQAHLARRARRRVARLRARTALQKPRRAGIDAARRPARPGGRRGVRRTRPLCRAARNRLPRVARRAPRGGRCGIARRIRGARCTVCAPGERGGRCIPPSGARRCRAGRLRCAHRLRRIRRAAGVRGRMRARRRAARADAAHLRIVRRDAVLLSLVRRRRRHGGVHGARSADRRRARMGAALCASALVSERSGRRARARQHAAAARLGARRIALRSLAEPLRADARARQQRVLSRASPRRVDLRLAARCRAAARAARRGRAVAQPARAARARERDARMARRAAAPRARAGAVARRAGCARAAARRARRRRAPRRRGTAARRARGLPALHRDQPQDGQQAHQEQRDESEAPGPARRRLYLEMNASARAICRKRSKSLRARFPLACIACIGRRARCAAGRRVSHARGASRGMCGQACRGIRRFTIQVECMTKRVRCGLEPRGRRETETSRFEREAIGRRGAGSRRRMIARSGAWMRGASFARQPARDAAGSRRLRTRATTLRSEDSSRWRQASGWRGGSRASRAARHGARCRS